MLAKLDITITVRNKKKVQLDLCLNNQAKVLVSNMKYIKYEIWTKLKINDIQKIKF